MKITLVTGPMFAGKTTYLMKRIQAEKKRTCILATHATDTRFTKEEDSFINHNGDTMKHPVLRISSLQELPDLDKDANILLAIDEAQFFEDIVEYIRTIWKKRSHPNLEIVICGLNGDFMQSPFGKEPYWISKLISIATDVIYLKAKCWKCKGDANYSIRNIDASDQTSKFLVGGSEIYSASCHEHLPEST